MCQAFKEVIEKVNKYFTEDIIQSFKDTEKNMDLDSLVCEVEANKKNIFFENAKENRADRAAKLDALSDKLDFLSQLKFESQYKLLKTYTAYSTFVEEVRALRGNLVNPLRKFEVNLKSMKFENSLLKKNAKLKNSDYEEVKDIDEEPGKTKAISLTPGDYIMYEGQVHRVIGNHRPMCKFSRSSNKRVILELINLSNFESVSCTQPDRETFSLPLIEETLMKVINLNEKDKIALVSNGFEEFEMRYFRRMNEMVEVSQAFNRKEEAVLARVLTFNNSEVRCIDQFLVVPAVLADDMVDLYQEESG